MRSHGYPVSDNLVKSGNLRSHEAQTPRFIATNIPVSKVHDIHWEDGKVVAIVMDYMPGKRLDEAWDTLDSDQKLFIASELHSYINQLRDLKGGYIGPIDRGKAVIGQIVSIEGGPFDSEQPFIDLCKRYNMVLALGGIEVVVALELPEKSSGCSPGDMNKFSHVTRITRRDKNSIMSGPRAVREYGQMDCAGHCF